MAEDDILGAEQLREVVGGEADAPLRQIEAEFVPHRPAQPWVDPRRRRPHAFDQPADDNAVGLHQPGFQRPIDVKPRACFLDPPHCTVGKCGLEHFRIVVERNRHSAQFLLAKQIVKGGSKRQPRRLLERQRHAVLVTRQRDQDFAMTVRQLGKIMRL